MPLNRLPSKVYNILLHIHNQNKVTWASFFCCLVMVLLMFGRTKRLETQASGRERMHGCASLSQKYLCEDWPFTDYWPWPFVGHFFDLTLLLSSGLSISDIQSRDVLDLLLSLNTTDTPAGFQYTSGPNNQTPAILLQGKTRWCVDLLHLTSSFTVHARHTHTPYASHVWYISMFNPSCCGLVVHIVITQSFVSKVSRDNILFLGRFFTAFCTTMLQFRLWCLDPSSEIVLYLKSLSTCTSVDWKCFFRRLNI